MTYRVRVYGPNLRDQSLGVFHAHKEGCKGTVTEARRYGYTEEEADTIDAETRWGVVWDIYPPTDYGYADDPHDHAYMDDIHFAPCLDDLPEEVSR